MPNYAPVQTKPEELQNVEGYQTRDKPMEMDVIIAIVEPTSAAEKLQCPNSVLSFVINATDVKDECEGLRKAFDISCGGSKKKKKKSNGIGTRRRLNEDDTVSVIAKKVSWNPVMDYLKRRVDELKHRRLENDEGADTDVEDDNVMEIPQETPPEEEEEEDEKPLSPSLPTTSVEMEDNMANDALTLNTDLEDIVKAIGDINNHTSHISENDENGVVHHHQSSAEEAEDLRSSAIAVSAVINSPELIETQACCRSILKVFHEECDSPEEEEFNDKRLFVIVCVIALCGIVKSLIRHFKLRWLPEAGGCILVGMVGALFMTFLPNMDFGFQHDMFLRLMVPPIGRTMRSLCLFCCCTLMLYS